MRGHSDVSERLENYLETILDLEQRHGAARVRDIARALSVHKSTVTASLRALSGKGLVNYAPYEMTTLTEEGRHIAASLRQNHHRISRFLSEVLLVDHQAAEENACRMEHVMDENILQRLVLFARFVKTGPRTGREWTRRFAAYLERGGPLRGEAASPPEGKSGAGAPRDGDTPRTCAREETPQ